MENFVSVAQVVILVIIAGMGIFNWIYKLEVEKVTRKEGFVIPKPVQSLLAINRFVPFLAAVLILLFILVRSNLAFR